MIPRILAATLVLAALAAPVARAQPAASDPDGAARTLFLEGESLYAEGRYEEAVAKYEEAYHLSARPLLLFNVANAYERLGAYRKAADALRRYLPDAKPDEAVLLRKRIARLDERAEVREREQAELASLRERDCPVCPVVPPAKPERSSRLVSYGLLGAGVVAVSTGVVFGVVARDAHGDAQAGCRDSGLCPESAQSDIDRERRFSLMADVSIGLGVVAVAAGVYTTLRASARDERAERRERMVVAPAAGPSWAGVGIAGSF